MRSGSGRCRPPLRRFIRILDAFVVNWPAGANRTDLTPRDVVSKKLFEDHPAGRDITTAIPEVTLGAEFITPVGQRRLRIVRLAGEGTRAKVYEAIEIESGTVVALKIIHERTPLNLQAIAMETVKVEALTTHGLPCSRIVESGVTYVIKEWVSGTGGDQWLEQWLARGADPDDPAFVALLGFFRDASAKGLRIDDFRPSNLILRAGQSWVPIDVGRITIGVSPAFAMRCYRERFLRRWLWVSRSPFWFLVYWMWRRVRRPDRGLS